MPKQRTCKLLTVIMAALFTVSCSDNNQQTTSSANVILLIGDGMDEHQITMARHYLYGAEGAFNMESMPVRTSVTVQTLREEDTSQFRFVADSANTASTLATGQLTSRGRISTSAGEDADMETILEKAQQSGYRTGIVTTASVTDATPAAFAAHVVHRGCQSPGNTNFYGAGESCGTDKKADGGPGTIAEQLAVANVDVLLGGGMAAFADSVTNANGSQTNILDIAKNQGYQLTTNADELIASGDANKLLGLFGKSTLPTEWIGEGNRKATLIEMDAEGNPLYPEPFSCVANPKHNGTPTLSQMTESALALLSKDNQQGFFLMVEGASIDKQSHKANPCGQIGELRAFDDAVKLAREFATNNPNTLIIVTADHGQAGQVVPLPETYEFIANAFARGKAQYSRGHYAVLNTLGGELMAVNYATNSTPAGVIEMHTGMNVPAYMEGPNLNDVPILIDQRTINQLMQKHLGLTPVEPRPK